MHTYLLQLLLPLADNHGRRFPRSLFEEVERELLQFGGFTAYPRAPASGLWVSPSEQVKQDDVIVYEAMSETLDLAWWKAFARNSKSGLVRTRSSSAPRLLNSYDRN